MTDKYKARSNFIDILDELEEEVSDAAHECSGIMERAVRMAKYNKLLEAFDSQRKELEELRELCGELAEGLRVRGAHTITCERRFSDEDWYCTCGLMECINKMEYEKQQLRELCGELPPKCSCIPYEYGSGNEVPGNSKCPVHGKETT